MRFSVRGCYDGERAAEGGFDFLVEVVARVSGWISKTAWGIRKSEQERAWRLKEEMEEEGGKLRQGIYRRYTHA